MRELNEQSLTQLRNIEKSSGKTLVEFVALVRAEGFQKHGQIVAWLKSAHALTHGNANLISLLVRDELEGGAVAPDAQLSAQYTGAKQSLLPIYKGLAAAAESLGSDVSKVIQKTGVSFRRNKQFALVQAPSSKRVTLGLNLPTTPDSERVKETKGMCTHQVNLSTIEEIDEDVLGWLRESYGNC